MFMDGFRTTRRAASHGALNSAFSAQADAQAQAQARPQLPPQEQVRTRSLVSSLASPASSQGFRRQTPASVNDNASLLPFPSTLESMLKTTTETGDIGVFSIKPIASSATCHQPPRRRTPLWDHNGTHSTAHNAPFRRPDPSEHSGTRIRDDRRRLPSYRDTTSEIISMYESESQRSTSSFFFRPIEDAGPRSFSLTSCGSKTHPPPPSGAGFNAWTGPSFLQRPRSPFPYPTRLKRPGVRPSSPALTENGSIDYSKMIGIDRVSHRTDYHRSYRPPYHPARRGPPLSQRPDYNRSIRSYSHGSWRSQRTCSAEARPGPGSEYRDQHHRPPHPWSSHVLENSHEGSSADPSTSSRVTSFGSIIDKYQHSSHSFQRPRNLHAASGPFYYDYTEEFENERNDSTVRRTRSPPAPVPTLATNGRPSSILAQSRGSVAGAHHVSSRRMSSNIRSDEEEDDFGHYGRIISHYISSESLETHPARFDPSLLETQLSSSPETAHLEPDRDDERPKEGDSPVSQAGQSAATGSLGTGSASTNKTRSPRITIETWSPRKSDNSKLADLNEESSKTRRSHDGSHAGEDHGKGTYKNPKSVLRSAQIALAQNSSEVENIASHSMRSEKSPRHLVHAASVCGSNTFPFDKPEDQTIPIRNSLDRQSSQRHSRSSMTRSQQKSFLAEASESVSSHGALFREDHGPDPSLCAFRRHRRNHAVLRLNQMDERSGSDGFHATSSPARTETPMLAPKPISPAKELRVRNSIPQLLKLVPTMQGDVSHRLSPSPEFPQEGLNEPVGYSSVQLTSITPQRPIQPREPITMDLETYMKQNSEGLEAQPKASKLRLRLASPPSSSWDMQAIDEHITPWSTDDGALSPRSDGLGSNRNNNNNNNNKRRGRKLRLKASRSALDSTGAGLAAGPGAGDGTGTIRRSAGFEKSATILEIAQSPTKDLFGAPNLELEETPSDPAARNEGAMVPSSGGGGGGVDGGASSPHCPNTQQQQCADSPQGRDGFYRGTSLDAAGFDGRPLAENHHADGKGRKGLKKKFSEIKAKLSESLSRRTGRDLASAVGFNPNYNMDNRKDGEDENGDASEFEPDSPRAALLSGTNAIATTVGTATTRGNAKAEAPPASGGASRPGGRRKSRVRKKLSRLVRGAKVAVQHYVHRRRGPVVAMTSGTAALE